MDKPMVALGQRWRRKNGVVYVVTEQRGSASIDFLLVPEIVPVGIRARRTWKWDQAIRFEMEHVN